jgi:hypothetical protein
MVTFENVPWPARQRRNRARMRQVNALMIEHYQRYPRNMRWIPNHQRFTISQTQNGAAS